MLERSVTPLCSERVYLSSEVGRAPALLRRRRLRRERGLVVVVHPVAVLLQLVRHLNRLSRHSRPHINSGVTNGYGGTQKFFAVFYSMA